MEAELEAAGELSHEDAQKLIKRLKGKRAGYVMLNKRGMVAAEKELLEDAKKIKDKKNTKIEVVEKIIDEAIKHNIKYLTLYAFSTENWRRPKKEINYLFQLLENFLINSIDDLSKKKIKLKIIGIKNFSKKLNKLLKLTERKTKKKILNFRLI